MSSSGLWSASHLPPAPLCYLPSGTVTEPRGDGTAEDKTGTRQQKGEQGREVVPWKSQAFSTASWGGGGVRTNPSGLENETFIFPSG